MLSTIGSPSGAIKDAAGSIGPMATEGNLIVGAGARLSQLATMAREARVEIGDLVSCTPVREVPAELLPPGPDRLVLKLENQQVSGSFKARGAAHFIARLLAQQQPAGVLTYSSGNHGRAVAEAAARQGLAALVVAPDSIDRVKAAAVIEAGAELVRVGPTTDERKLRAEQIAAERGWVLVPPFDHEWIISGQGTLVLELIEQIGTFEHLWLPVGGGGLAAGCAAVASVEMPECQVHTVEPEGSAALARSLQADQRLHLEATTSEADGLLPLTVGELNWELLSRAGVAAEVISEGQLMASLSILHQRLEIQAEPSGSCSAAPLLAARSGASLAGGTHVAVVSGGNVSSERLARLLSP